MYELVKRFTDLMMYVPCSLSCCNLFVLLKEANLQCFVTIHIKENLSTGC